MNLIKVKVKQKNFLLTLDLENIYTVKSLKGSELEFKKFPYIDIVHYYLDLLDQYKIKSTIFILRDIMKENPNLIKLLSRKGHEIAIHGYDHQLLYLKSKKQIVYELTTFKSELEDLIGEKIIGYRAPSFSLFEGFEDILSECGFLYDSSYVNLKGHDLYGHIDIKKWEMKNGYYFKSDIYEFPISSFTFLRQEFPLGGGYFRVFPYLITKKIIDSILNKDRRSFFVFFIHPFEVLNKKLNLDFSSIKWKLRFNLFRKSSQNKFIILINDFGENMTSIKDYCLRNSIINIKNISLRDNVQR